MYRILTLDGGGIRGVLALTVLQRLEDKFPNLLKNTHLFAGTSTGGIIALGFASGLSIQQLSTLYVEHGKEIFDRSLKSLWGIAGPKYSNKKLEQLLKTLLFQDKKLGELERKVLIPSFDLDNKDKDFRTWKPKFFNNFGTHEEDNELPLYKIALYTSAAPTYFPSKDGYVDGGMVANNPSVASICQVLKSNDCKLEDICLLSIGTGEYSQFIENEEFNFGYLNIKTIVDILLNSPELISDYESNQLLKEKYCRIQPQINTFIDLDDCAKIPKLKDIGNLLDLEIAEQWLAKYWD